ncbi:glycosyltransferase family 2 protein [Acidiferrobacter sp.]|uniref:glycosyltransferase n=1 Tax=Acidiferrobacter sp. TaxID=1872107 RepID=UPI002601E2B1|nr:glycosyltransferase family 2 protein [Acidiferrobacter sp.]
MNDTYPVSLAGHGFAPHAELIAVLQPIAYGVVLLVVLYTLRHLFFTLNRLFGHQRHPYLDITEASWPPVTVVIPAHNEQQVIAHILARIISVDYPKDRLRILAIDDRSTDETPVLLDAFASLHPGQVQVLHRPAGALPGKAAALVDATQYLMGDIALVFDADYLPGPGLVKQLVAPFFDPEVGGVMGRVVPYNSGTNLLTHLLELERSGGYQVDQQARANLRLIPQFGGTVGGVRVSALRAIGGWNPRALAEDTDITYRLAIAGWKIAYQNRSECYEEVVETWPARYRQLRRWSRGHNQVLFRHLLPLLRSSKMTRRQRIDGAFLLGIYAMAPVLLTGWVVLYILWLCGDNAGGLLLMLAVVSYGTFGNAAAFYEIASALRLDGERDKVKGVPLILIGFFVSTYAATAGFLAAIGDILRPTHIHWHKTPRYRDRTAAAPDPDPAAPTGP